MKRSATQYKRHRFPPEIIQYAVWLYHRFNPSHRDSEDLLARRGVLVTHESIRFWCNKFGPHYAHRLRRRHRGYGDTLFIDEVLVRIRGRQRHLWRAVDQDDEVVDVLLQERRDAASARRFFRRNDSSACTPLSRTSSTWAATWSQRVTTGRCVKAPLRHGTWLWRFDGNPTAGDCGRAELTWQYPSSLGNAALPFLFVLPEGVLRCGRR
jgi:hypothetical protein